MAYISVADAAKKWNLSERSVRNYCAIGKIPNAVLAGKAWQIPEDAEKPKRTNAKIENALLSVLREEKKKQRKGGIYHKIQVDLTYNSNHIEGSRLTHDQTRYIFETNTIGFESGAVNVDDVVETANHFRCIDMVIDNAMYPLSETLIKRLHLTLKNGQAIPGKTGLLLANINAFLTRSAGEIPPLRKKSKRRFPSCCLPIIPSRSIRSNKSLRSIMTSSAFIRFKTATGVLADLSFSRNVLKTTLSRLLSRMT